MDNQRVRFDHIDRAARVVDAVASGDLRRAQIRQQRDIGRRLAQFARQTPVIFAFQRHALRTDAHRQP